MVRIDSNVFGKCSFSIRVNEHYVGQISPRIGFGQGDPLSPYLFNILCTKGLPSLLRHSERR